MASQNNITVVTDKCYISATKIKHVAIEEFKERVTLKKEYLWYKIEIHYSNIDSKTGNEDDQRCDIQLHSKKDCERVYKEIICQIRDQNPDKALMDKLVEDMLGT